MTPPRLLPLSRRTVSCLVLASTLLLGSSRILQAQVTILSESFEGQFPTDGGWAVGNSGGGPTWDDVNAVFGGEGTHSGGWKGYCAGTAYPAGSTEPSPMYANNMAAYMSRTINLQGYTSATLSFWHKLPGIEACCDQSRVVLAGIDPITLWSTGTPLEEWTQVTIDLTPYIGTAPTLRFEFTSDGSVTAEGWYLDDIVISGTAVPENDRCTGAIPLAGGYAMDTSNATSTGDPTPQCQANFGKGVWFTYQAAGDGPLTVSTCNSDFDTVLEIFTGTCRVLEPLPAKCNDDNGPACPGRQASVTFQGTAGTVYHILVGGYGGAGGLLNISAGVANDFCSGAIPLGEGQTYSMDTTGATTDSAATCQSSSGKNVWFSFTAPATASYAFSTCDSLFDTVLQVYQGSCDPEFRVPLLCNDDQGPSCAGTTASLVLEATAGTHYLISAGGYNNSSGRLSINISRLPPPQITCAPPKTVECGATWTFDPPIVSGSCGVISLEILSTVTNRTDACGNTYRVTRTWQATDACGTSAACSQTVTVVDLTPPVIICANVKTAECGTAWSFDPPTADDACGTPTLTVVSTVTNRIDACGQTYRATRTWRAEDGCGNWAQCSQTVTVLDTTPPALTCPADVRTNTAPGECGQYVRFTVTAQDACEAAPVLVCNPPSGSWFNVGSTLVTCTAIDGCGNSNQCSFTVTVEATAQTLVADYVRIRILGGSLEGVGLWMTPTVLDPTHVVRDVDSEVPDVPFPYRGWLVMIDDQPRANFGHAVRWLFVSEDLSRSTTPVARQFPPTVWGGHGAGPQVEFRCAGLTPLPCANLVLGRLTNTTFAPPSEHCLHAVLISGGLKSELNYARYAKNLRSVYQKLRAAGFADHNITVFYTDGATLLDLDNADGDGSDATGNDVSAGASKALIRSKIRALCDTLNPRRDHLFIYGSSHGADNQGLCLWDWNQDGKLDSSDVYSPAEFAADTTNARVRRLFVLFDQCYSGDFTPIATDGQHTNMVIYTAAQDNEPSVARQYMSFWERTSLDTSFVNAIHISGYVAMAVAEPLEICNGGPDDEEPCQNGDGCPSGTCSDFGTSTPTMAEGTPGLGDATLYSCEILHLLTVAPDRTNALLHLKTEPRTIYTVEYADSLGALEPPEWRTLQEFTGTGEHLEVRDRREAPKRFYRIREQALAFEEVPAWRMPDLSVTALTVAPDRVNPEEVVTFTATIVNRGTGRARSALVNFFVDDTRVAQVPVSSIAAGGSLVIEYPWTAAGAGRHRIRAELEGADPDDISQTNPRAGAVVWVAGETLPAADLILESDDLSALRLNAGESRTLNFRLRNPSFATLSNFTVRFLIDDVPVMTNLLEQVAAGEARDLEMPWPEITDGVHEITARFDPPDLFTNLQIVSLWRWFISIPGPSVLYATPAKDKWASLGPDGLGNGNPRGPDGSSGRMQAVAFHPSNPNIAYAGAERGGIFKTTNGGASWIPIGDKLPTLTVSAIAVDPKHPEIVYLASGAGSRHPGRDLGLFKSTDGGGHWVHFADEFHDTLDPRWYHAIRGTTRMAVRYPNPATDEVVVYVACNDGVVRYKSSDPFSISSDRSQWVQIKRGWIRDLVVHPNNAAIVYASVCRWMTDTNGHLRLVGDGIYRTSAGVNGGEATWENKTSQLFINGKETLPTLDLFPASPNVVYVASSNRDTNTALDIYQSDDEGEGWRLVATYPRSGPNALEGPYNPFLRSHPLLPNHVYFGGVKLYEAYWGSGGATTRRIDGIHDDQKALEFRSGQTFPTRFWALNDGGLWEVIQVPPAINVAWPLNRGLRTMEFYDLDASASDPNLMIGGTQDNGTMVWQGQPAWRMIQGGDGNFSLISPTDNKRFYAQYQFLDDLWRTDQGVNADDWPKTTWTAAGSGLPKGWKVYNAFMTINPTDGTHLLSQGDQVYETVNSGDSWVGRGPTGILKSGNIQRVLFQPLPDPSTWLAGTTSGRLWMRRHGTWTNQFDHPDRASVLSMAFAPTDPKVLFVLFGPPARSDRRVYRFDQLSAPTFNWVATPITDYLPINVIPTVVCGDGHRADTLHIGTAAGVYRGQRQPDSTWRWQPYNDGLPLADVSDLLVDRTSRQLRAATFGRGVWAVITGP